MNKHLYRIIFNKARNMLMVVSDIATSGQGSTVRRRSRRQSSQCLCRLTALRLSLLLATGCISLTAQANIVADGQAPGNQQPTILNSANGTPQIDIQTPNAAGISHNTYTQFDIDKRGVILNNSHDAVQTQLGGMVAGNPWLAKAEAKIILNEVNSINTSKLNGWIEVAGQKADVIIANPAGITCNGCGFINAHRATLTTGQAMMEQGRLKGFDIERGEVRIEDLGLDSSQQNYTEIIARSVVINGKLHAKDLKITTGRNIVDAAHQNIEKKTADGSKNPSFTLDVAALGGMYANKIVLVGTEFGVGVRNAGHIGATAGDVRITVDGQIENSGTIAARSNTTIKAESIQSAKGSILAAGIDDKGKATLPGSLTLTAKQQIQANGKNLATNTLEVQSKKIDLSGSQTSANNIQLTASQQEISTANATVTADRFTAKTPSLFNNDGGTLVAREINLTTPDLSNKQGKINQTGNGELVLNTQTLNNHSGTILNEGKRLAITTRNLDNSHGKIANNGNDLNLIVHEKADNTEGGTIQLAGKGKLSLNTHQWLGDGGKLLSNGELDVQAHNLQLNKKAVTTADKITITTDTLSHQSGIMQQQGKDRMSLTAKTLNNQNGEIKGNGNLKIDAATLGNSKGKIIAAKQGALELTVDDALNNQDGQLEAGQDIQLTATQLDNNRGKIAATGGSTELIIGKNIENVDGRIEAKTTLTTKSQALNNHQGSLLAQQIDSQTKGHKFTNTAGQVIAQEKLTLNSGELDNTSGLLQSGSDMIVNTHGQKLTNTKDTKNGDEKETQKGTILSKGNLELRTGDINNTAGIISAKGKTTLNAGSVDNTDGQLLSQQMAELTTQALNNTRGQIQSESSLLLDTQNQTLTNTDSGKTGGIIAKDSLRISSGKLTNDAGVILGHGINIDTHQQALSNQSGAISSKKNLKLDSGELNSTGGKIESTGDMILDTHGEKLTTAKSGDTGGVISEGTLTLTTGEIDNHDGTITGTGTTTITGRNLHNQRGKLVSKTGPLTLTVNKTDNSGGLLQSASDLTLDTQGGLLTNTNSGKDRGIISIGNMKLTTQGVNNDAGLIHAGKNLILDGQKGTITNRDSQPNQGIRSSGDLTLTASAIDNHQGSVEADKQLTVTSGTVDNTGGLLKSGTTLSLNTQGQKLTNAQSGEKSGIRSGSDLTLEAGEIDNTAGLIDAQGETTLTSQNLNNTGGKILSRKKADLTTQAVNNQSGQIQSATSLKLDTQQHELTSTDGRIIAENALELATGKLINDRGSIRGDQTHINTHQQALNNVAGTITSKKNLKLDSGKLNSTGGRIESAGDMTLDTHGEKLITAKSSKTGGVFSKGTMTLTTGEIDNQDGFIKGTGTTTVTGGELKNQGGTLASETSALTLTVKKTDNSGGLLKSAGDLTIDTQGELLTNLNSGKTGGIISAGNVKLTTQGINNEAGWIHADKNLTLDGKQGKITNRNSQPEQGISSKGELTITAGTIDNQQGRVIADKQLNVTSTGAVDNTSGKMLSQHQQLTMNTGELNNTSGLLQSQTTLSLNTHGQKLINAQSGNDLGIRSGSDLTLEAGDTDNTAGRIVAEDALELTTGKLINDHGDIRGNETRINTHQQALNNVAGTIFSKKNLQLDSGELNSTSGRIESTGDMTLNTHGEKLTNAKSGETKGVISKGTMTLTTGEIDNQDGFIKGTGTTIVTGGELKNQGGTLASETSALTLTVKKTDNSGGLLKSAGDLTLDTQGELLTNLNSGETGGIIGAGNVKLTAQGINNKAGWIHADKNLTLDGKQGKITNRNSQPKQGISSKGELTITAGAIDNQQGRVIADKQLNVTSTGAVDNTSGKMLSQHQQLTMNTGELNNTSGLLQSKTTLSLNTHGQKLTNTQSGNDLGIRSGSDLTLEAGDTDNTAGRIVAEDALELTTGKLINDRGDIRGNETRINTHQQALNNVAGTIFSKKNLKLDSGELNSTGGRIESTGDMTLDTHGEKLTTAKSGETKGVISKGTLTLTTGEIDNQDGFIKGTGTTTVTGGELKNQGGTLASETGSLTLTVKKTDNSGGLLKSKDDLTLDTQGELLTNLNSGKTGGIISTGNVKLTTQGINNEAGWIHADQNLTLDGKQGKIINRNSQPKQGISSQGELTITAGAIDNQQGRVIADRQLNVTSTGTVDNTSGKIVSQNQQLTMNTGELNNTSGLLQSKTALSLNTHGQKLTNTQSGDDLGIRSDSDLTLEAGEIDNTDGKILSKGKADLTTQAVNNQRGLIQSSASLKLDTQQHELTNTDSGKNGIVAEDALELTTGKLINDRGDIRGNETRINTHQQALNNLAGTIFSKKNLQLDSGELNSTGGRIESTGDMTLDTHGEKLTTAKSGDTGGVISNGALTLTTGEIDNQDGVITGTRATTVTGGELKNQGGTLASKTSSLTLTVKKTDNSDGLLQSEGDLTLDTQGELLTNLNSGKTGGIIGTGNVKLTAQGINNEAGWIHADKNLTLDAQQGKITNRNSQPKQGISSKGELTITADTIDNQQGRVIADKQLKVTSTGTVDNTSGKMVSQHQQLELNTGELNNAGGLLQSNTTLSLNTHGQKLINTQSGDKHGILSGSDLILEAGEIDNTAGKIDSQGETTLTSQNLNNTDGKIISQKKTELTTLAVNNQSGLIQSSASLKLDTQQQKLTNTNSGKFNGILALDGLKLITGELINDLGYIRSDETHIDTHKQTLSNLTGTIVSRKNLQLDSGKLDSTGGLIKSDGNMTLDTHGEKLTNAKSGKTNGVISKGTMTLTTGEIDNQDGAIIGTGATTVTGGELKNQGGTLISEKDALTLSVNQTDNSGGLLQSASKLTLNTHGHSLTNKNSVDKGGIRSQDDISITSGDLHNQVGMITSRKITTLNTAAVNNTQGTIAGAQQIKLTTQAFNNQQGTVDSDGNLNLNTQGQRLNNQGDKDKSSKFSAQGDLTLDIGELNNDAGFIAADGKTKITGTTLTNKKGRIAGNSGLDIHSQTLTNHSGSLKSAKTVNIDTNGQLLNNQHGQIMGDGNTTVTSGKLDNQHGHIQGKKLTIDTGQTDTDNQDGKLLSTDTMSLNTLQLDNRRGQVNAIGDATIDAQKQTNNTGGFIHSDHQLTLKTAELINRETNHLDQGIEAQDLIIEAQQVDNTQGALRGTNRLQAIISQSLKNEQGLVSGGKQLTIKDETQELTVNNQQGTLIGSEMVNIKANSLSGDGQTLSQGDMEVKLKQDFHNTGNIATDGKLSLETDGNIINNSTIKAWQTLHLGAQNLTNTQTAEISAKQTEVNVRNTLTNTGLIDGEQTHLTAKVLDNTGTGRIYGDQIALKTGTLNNTAKDGKAAVIAARDQLDIGTGTLNNSNHAQIYSVGDMRIGGQLDENLAATSQAGRLSNHAATIEAGGNLKIDAAIIKNTNNGLVTHIVETEKSQRHEAVLSGHTTRYDWSQVDTSYSNKYGVHTAVMPDGSSDDEFYEYRYTRTINETQIKESDPGKILSGGNMTINSAMLTNDDSQIVAGGILGGDIDELHNNATKGERIITDEGSEIRWYAKKKKRRFRGTKTSQGKDWDDYNPAPIIETIDLKALAWQGNTRPNSTGITIGDRQQSHVQSAPAGINQTSRMAEAGEVTFTNATINAITLPNRDIPIDRPFLSPTGQQTEQILSSSTVALPNRDALPEHPTLPPTSQQTEQILSSSTVALPNRDALPEHPTLPPTSQQTEQILSSGTVALPNRDALPEHPTLPSTSQQTEQILSSGTVALPNRDELTEHPVLPPVQQTERVLPPATVTLPNSVTLDERPLVLPTGQQFELALPPDTVQGQSIEPLIRIVAPDTRLPDNSLFVVQPGSDSHYLVETDPKFTQYKKWLGTDYMQQQLTLDPTLAHKRLGDGFYEQRLVREQITQLTGQRYLAGHNNDETQFKALMEAGVAFSKRQQLTPGIALSPSQMALLTSDIIWLTNRTVTLADGTKQTVTVPQVYARVNKGDLTGDGALLSGKNVTINSRGDITNSGAISGREITKLTANNLTNSGFIQSGKVDLTARQDITNLGGQIRGSDHVSARANRDIISTSTLRGEGADRWLDRQAGIYVQNDNGTMSLKALNNIRLTASEVDNAGKDSQTEITAGLDLTLDTLRTHRTENSDWGSDNYRHLTQQHDVGSQISTAGNLALRAGNNLNATAANMNAGQRLTARAGNNLTLDAGTASSDLIEHSKQTSKGLLSKSSVETHDEVHERRAQSTTLSGDSVTVQAGNNLNIIGSNVAGTQDVNLAAGNQLTVTTADEARHETHFKQEKKSGLMGTGGIGFTVGKASQKSTTDIDSNLNKGSTVGSSQGSVTFSAGKQLNLHGSDVVAGRDMQLSGQNINITSAENSHTAVTKTEQKQSGLTVALSGTAGGALNSAVQTVQAARSESDSRIKALQGTKAALSGVQAVQAARLANAKGGDDKANNNLVGVNLSYGSQSSRSELKQHQTTQQGSSLMTGDNLTLTASGTPDQNGDIRIQGGQLQAGKDLRLNASRDIQLSSSQNTEQTTGKNSSRGSSLGVGFTAGPGGTGINLSVSTNRGKGSESGNGVSHNETTLDAGQTVTLNAGRDATLKGAQVSGEQIAADVKRHLTLSSEQDSNRYDMKQQNVSAGISANVGPGSGGSLNLSASRDKIHSNFDSVQEQTGLFAGKGGYQVKVGEHTQLDGAVIASTADKDKNTLDTGTLGFGDIKNKADFKTEHHSVSISTGGSVGGMLLSNMAANTLGGANREGHAQSTTHAAVSDGTLIIRDKDSQQQDVTTLSRDTDHANNALSPIFDKEKEQQRLKQAQLIGEISAQVIDIASTEGAIIATKAAHAKLENISDPDREAARKKLENAGKTNITPEQIKDQIYKTAYNQALNESGLGTGGKYHTALQAATAAIQGLAGGNIGQALAGGASPYLAGVIKDLTTDPKTHQVDVVTNTLAHAILGAVAAEVSGNNALAGAAGAASGELAARELMKHIHGENVKVSDLSEEEKQTISTLSTLAAGLAGGIAGDSTGSAVTGAQAGKNAVENNFLTAKDVHELKEELLEAEKTGASKQTIYDKFKERSEKNRQEGVADNCSHNPGCVVSVWEMMNSGTDAASGLNRTSFFSSLSNEEMTQLNRFVQAENAESAQAIYQSLPDVVKKVVEGKEFAEQFGVMPKVGSSSGMIGLGIAGKKPATKDTGNTGTKGSGASETSQGNAETKGASPSVNQPVNATKGTTGNYRVHDLNQAPDPALDLNKIRQETKTHLKSRQQMDDAAVSYAAGSVTVNGKTEYYLSVSGKSWSGNSPTTVNIGGVNYKVIKSDSQSVPSVEVEAGKTNLNHAEQKLFSHIQDTYKGQKADVNISIQNTSAISPGMCKGCGSTSQSFAENNKDFNINIYHGTTGTTGRKKDD